LTIKKVARGSGSFELALNRVSHYKFFRGFRMSEELLQFTDKILIVDDNAVNRKLLAGILKKEGYWLIEACDGEQAVELAAREHPDLILLDIMMPKMDGYQACVEIKKNPAAIDTPIIFLSAKTEAKDKIKGLELGASDYVTKPFDRGEVLARVRSQLKIHHLTKKLIQANEELVKKQKRLDEDLEAAAGIQQSLLPQNPPRSKQIEIAWNFMPCEKIGGDIFNIFRLDEEHWAIYMVDVSGHGVPSALVTVSVSQVLRPQTEYLMKKSISPPPYYKVVSPAEVLEALDREYPIDRFNKYFTISYLILNVRSGVLKYSNAAHPPPVLLHPDGTMEFLKEGGTIIGMGGMLPFQEGKKQLREKDKLFVYTDGIVEYENGEGIFYGEERFHKELLSLKDKPISVIVDSVLDSLMDFGNGINPQDDISLVGLEYKGNAR